MQSAFRAALPAFPEPAFDTWATCERLISSTAASQITADSPELAYLLAVAGIYLQGRAALADVLAL
jgi:hypothetical protein